MQKDRFYFSHIPDENEWSVGNWARMIAIPHRWWSIREWIFINEFLAKNQIYFKKESASESEVER